MEENNKCISCPLFKDKLNELMSRLDSVFDIAFEMKEFESKCSLKCSQGETYNDIKGFSSLSNP